MELLLLQGSAPGVVKISVTDLRWSVRVYGRPVPDYSDLYDKFSNVVSSTQIIVAI